MSAADGHLYLKQFDPLGFFEVFVGQIGPDEVEKRLAPFTKSERTELDHALRFVNVTLDQHWPQEWVYVRLARRLDVLKDRRGEVLSR